VRLRVPLRASLEALAHLALPVAVAWAWTLWALRAVAGHERAIAAAHGLAYATFVQVCHGWAQGWGWHQTVHFAYRTIWAWGGHYGPVIFASAWLASGSDSAWALARIQAVAVSLGCLAAWQLGLAEARLPGAIAGLALYACSGLIALLALQDYQDLVLGLPLLLVAVHAARHRGPLGFLLAGAALCCVREEYAFLLPLVGLAGGVHRLWLAAALAAAWLGLLAGVSDFASAKIPVFDLLEITGRRGWRLPDLGAVDLAFYRDLCGPSFPWLLLSPVLGLGVAGIALFQHLQGAAGITGPDFVFPHHYAPLAGLACAAAIVGVGRLMRAHRWLAVPVLLAVVGLSAWSFVGWVPRIASQGIRVTSSARHPAWALIARIPDDAVLLVPSEIAPAVFLRRRVATENSLDDRIDGCDVQLVLDDGRLAGRRTSAGRTLHPGGAILARSGAWHLARIEAPARDLLGLDVVECPRAR